MTPKSLRANCGEQCGMDGGVSLGVACAFGRHGRYGAVTQLVVAWMFLGQARYSSTVMRAFGSAVMV